MRGATPRQPVVRKTRKHRPSARRKNSMRQFSPINFARDHSRVLLASLGRLYSNPLSNLMTAMVIGISLALPGTLLIMLDNLQRVTGSWHGSTTVSVYLKASVSKPSSVRAKLLKWPEIDKIDIIPREQALEEFRKLSGFGDALDTLEDNPLPNVLVLIPTDDHHSTQAGEALVNKLRRLPEADLVQLDLLWLKRLSAMMELGQRIVLAIGLLLGLGVLLIIGNTIRLEIQNRRDEIEVTKLVGGTDAFIRRPFLYMGCWQGLAGGVIAWLLLNIAIWQLGGPVRRLAGLYANNFQLESINLASTAALLLAGTVLGLIGSWLAVGRHLDAIEPA